MGQPVILDAGVFISLENPAKRGVVLALAERMLAEGVIPATNGPVLAQAWRNPPRQAMMARLAKATTVYPFGDAKTVGLRCATSGTADVVDASLAVLADQLGLTVLTTDGDDMAKLNVAHTVL